MSKAKKSFFCQNCGNESSQWQGQCNSCKEWNTIIEEILDSSKNKIWDSFSEKIPINPSKSIKLNEIVINNESRLSTNDVELDRVLGGGLIPGSVTLIGGEPGIGKSTLLLQVSLKLNKKVLYISGEESHKQIKLRADRINHNNPDCFILNEIETEKIFKQIVEINPSLIIIDSIQTLYSKSINSSAGSVSQLRGSSSELITFSKKTNIPVILVGHITKDGSIAGPKVLEHMVDTVIQFEGDRNHLYRIIRAKKNRYGSTNEIGIYEMTNNGLIVVNNPSQLLLSNTNLSLSGHSIASTMKGLRPLMIEIQSLVSSAVYGTPQRSATGFNSKRLNMILAILEKKAGFNLGSKDVFLNITGGLNIEDPSIDLSVIASILSSYNDIPLSKKMCFTSEVGLSGELRPVPKIEQRIKEAEKLGFDTIVIANPIKTFSKYNSIKIKQLNKIEDLINLLFN
ncbi:MAG: DNA repair protein RadA [Flavobacteriaceae bacterium]|nr:DNA repair protein RadA [Flavobacteriaceae bacterium]